ncbi:hypothetical protein KRMM14A1259_63030 [Krasilnikovia sp. MM14-A1259]
MTEQRYQAVLNVRAGSTVTDAAARRRLAQRAKDASRLPAGQVVLREMLPIFVWPVRSPALHGHHSRRVDA